MRAAQEQSLAAACHLFNIVPVWGLIFCGWIWYALREESRLVVGHARQAMAFHAALLAGLLVYFILGNISRLLSVISASLGDAVSLLNDGVMILFLLAYVTFCVLGAVRTFSGIPFQYPLVGLRG